MHTFTDFIYMIEPHLDMNYMRHACLYVRISCKLSIRKSRKPAGPRFYLRLIGKYYLLESISGFWILESGFWILEYGISCRQHNK